MADTHHAIVIIGGGTAGISVAARLALAGERDVCIVEPSTRHYYQPIWTLVGAGVFPKEISERDEADYIPPGVTWVRDTVTDVLPDEHAVALGTGTRLGYDQLVVAAGIQVDWNKIKGLEGNLGRGGICSNYRYDLVDSTWEAIRNFKGGNAVFTFPSTPIKCAGAPQKIMYLADDAFRRQGVRAASRITYASAAGAIFGVKKYAEALKKVVARKEIETLFRHDLVEVRADKKEAIFRHLDAGDERVLPYDLLHVVPPMSVPDFLKRTSLVENGWVAVHKYTLQHIHQPDVFALGDNASLPTSRTGAAIRKQAPVLVENLLAHRAGRPLLARYDGYASCPLVTGYGRLILAEFDYDGNPAESFPFDQAQERWSMYALKAYGLPEMYWNGMLRGRM